MRKVYADYAATTPLCLAARMAMMQAFDTYGNPSSLHQTGVEARNLVEEARAKVAKAINAEPDEIYFTSGATEANNWALYFGMCWVSEIEHDSLTSKCFPGLISDGSGVIKDIVRSSIIPTLLRLPTWLLATSVTWAFQRR